MAHVRWTHQALEDLDTICRFIARDAPRSAEVFADHMFQAGEHLEQFPFSGRVVPELGREDTRELIVERYRVVYRVSGDTVDILTVHHGSRLLGDLGS